MPTLAESLVAIRRELGFSQAEMAKRINRDRTTLARRETGALGVPIEDLEAFVGSTGRGLLLTPDGWSVVDPEPVVAPRPERDHPLDQGKDQQFQIPLLGCASAGPGYWNDGQPAETISIAGRWLTKLDGAILVQGDSMEPLLRDGDLVGVRLGEDYQVGDVVVAVAGYGECLLKVYAGVLEEEQLIILTSVNQDHPPVVERLGEIEVQGVAYGLLRPGRLKVRMRW